MVILVYEFALISTHRNIEYDFMFVLSGDEALSKRVAGGKITKYWILTAKAGLFLPYNNCANSLVRKKTTSILTLYRSKVQRYCDVVKWALLMRTSPEFKCLHPTSSKHEMCTPRLATWLITSFHLAQFPYAQYANVHVMFDRILLIRWQYPFIQQSSDTVISPKEIPSHNDIIKHITQLIIGNELWILVENKYLKRLRDGTAKREAIILSLTKRFTLNVNDATIEVHLPQEVSVMFRNGVSQLYLPRSPSIMWKMPSISFSTHESCLKCYRDWRTCFALLTPWSVRNETNAVIPLQLQLPQNLFVIYRHCCCDISVM